MFAESLRGSRLALEAEQADRAVGSAHYRELADNIETSAMVNVTKARHTLKRLIGTVRLERHERTGEPFYQVEMKNVRRGRFTSISVTPLKCHLQGQSREQLAESARFHTCV